VQGEVMTELGVCIGGNAPVGFRPIRPGVDPGVPKHPREFLRPAYVPSPPLIPDGLSDYEMALWLLRTYRGCIKSYTKKECFILCSRAQILKSKLYPKLISAAKKMRDMEIAPAAWAMFSYEMWGNFGEKKGNPPLAWMFSESRMEKHENWFNAEAGRYCGPRPILGGMAQDILRAWGEMEYVMMDARVKGKDLGAIFAEYFPTGIYVKAIELSLKECAETQAALNKQCARGDFIW
jgi:hypothetical protein